MQRCLDAHLTEEFTINYDEYIFLTTLYYYDQAGELVKTVSPQGVTTSGTNLTYASHTYTTEVRYNTLGGAIEQKTTDGGVTELFYDHAGRLVASENEIQRQNMKNSYTLYDESGRISEVGEIQWTLTELTSAITLDPVQWENWLQSGIKTDITRTFYDESLSTWLMLSRIFQN